MSSTVPSGARFDVYRAVTDKIVLAIEAGAGEFQLPWHRSGPAIARPSNAETGKAYRGVNVVALWAEATLAGYPSGHWASYQQWQSVGAQVRRGEAGSTIVFFREIERDEPAEADEEGARRFVARAFRVFNAAQVDGWAEPERVSPEPAAVIEAAEAFVLASGANVRHEGQSAFYRPGDDLIVLPERRRFCGTLTSTPAESYYATLLHELTHWTGAKHRLDREFGKRFGDHAYAIEELVAELGAAFLCADLGIANEPRPDHAAYLSRWLQILKQDARAIFTAARLASQAGDFLHGLSGKSGQQP
jgi:antirestriction protein ArdC